MDLNSTGNRLCAAWNIIHQCNYRCPYCFFFGRWAEENCHYLSVPAEEWIGCWDRVYDNYGSTHIHISGGEPFIYPGFIKIISEISKKHTLNIVTNLSCDLKTFIHEISPQRVTITPSFHPSFTQANSFIEKLKFLRENGFGGSASLVGYPPVLSQVLNIKKEFEKEGFAFAVLPFSGSYNGISYPQGYTAEEKKVVGLLAVNNPLNKEYQLERTSPKGKLCCAGQAYVRIHPDGTVLRCAHSGSIGNILKEGLRLLAAPLPCESDYCDCSNELIYIVENN